MPELPDILAYIAALEKVAVGRTLISLRIVSPSLLKTVDPAPSAFAGRRLIGLTRVGKRIALRFEGGLAAVVHLMIAGRFHKKRSGSKAAPRVVHAVFAFDGFDLFLTEASTKKRTSLHLTSRHDAIATFDRGGGDVFGMSAAEFDERLRRGNHTLKRALTDPELFDGIGNAYSDEILHAARLSPVRLASRLDAAASARLHAAAQSTLALWIERLVAAATAAFPEKVTAFREGMAVHGRYGSPCPVCSSPVQRIVYAENECNYCVTCQTAGKLLADRALSTLLGKDWPKNLAELDELRRR